MPKPKLSLKRRLIRLSLWLVSIAVVFIAYSELLGWQTFAVWMAYNVTKRCPQVNNLPQPLLNLAASQAPGTTVSYFGNTFEVPWKGITDQKAPKTIAIVKFASGQTLVIFAPTGNRGFLQDIAEDKTMGGPAMRTLFAEDIKGSPYEQESTLLNASSRQVKFFEPPYTSVRATFLVFLKSIAEDLELKTGIYTFHTPILQGFQIANPAYSGHVRLDFFDLKGNSLGEIEPYFGKDGSAHGTQADVNRIIQTYHPVASTLSADSAPSSK